MKLTTTFKTEDGSRELPLKPEWNIPAKDEDEVLAILNEMSVAVTERMYHCERNLLDNESGVAFNDGSYVVFVDGTRFSKSAYMAMQELISALDLSNSFEELVRELNTAMCIQLIKSVGANEELLNIALELFDAIQQLTLSEDYI